MGTTYTVGESDQRPWGSWAVLALGEGYAVKEITVNPGEILSLQSHRHRAEHWTIIEGCADVTIDDDVIRLDVDGTAFIPIGAKHRIANPGDGVMRFIEIQTGSQLDESDIERYDDRYGRAPDSA